MKSFIRSFIVDSISPTKSAGQPAKHFAFDSIEIWQRQHYSGRVQDGGQWCLCRVDAWTNSSCRRQRPLKLCRRSRRQPSHAVVNSSNNTPRHFICSGTACHRNGAKRETSHRSRMKPESIHIGKITTNNKISTTKHSFRRWLKSPHSRSHRPMQYLIDCEFPTACYLFTVSNSGRLFNHGRHPSNCWSPTLLFLLSPSPLTYEFKLWTWPRPGKDKTSCQMFRSEVIWFKSYRPNTHRHVYHFVHL